MHPQKKLNRGRLHPDGAAGLDRRRGWPLYDGTVPRPALAAPRRARPLSARIPPAGHGQTADLIPPGQWPGARQRGAEYGERRRASLAGRRIDRDPGRAARADPPATGGEPALLGALAGGTHGAPEPASRPTAAAHAAGAGQSDRPLHRCVRPLAVRAWHSATLYPAEWILLEPGGINPADPQAARPQGAATTVTAADHQLAGGPSARVESAPHAVRLGREAPRTTHTCLRAPAWSRRLGRRNGAGVAATKGGLSEWL